MLELFEDEFELELPELFEELFDEPFEDELELELDDELPLELLELFDASTRSSVLISPSPAAGAATGAA